MAATNEEQRLPQVPRSAQRDVDGSPASERETAEAQRAPRDSAHLADPDIDADAVTSVPGVGGIDDAGDVNPDPDSIHLPRDRGAHPVRP